MKSESEKNGASRPPVDRNRSEPDRHNMTKKPPREIQGGETKQKSPSRLSKVLRIAAAILSVAIGFPFVWEAPTARPTIHPPVAVDPKDLFALPFVIDNNLYFYTFYDVHPSCRFGGSHDFLIQDLTLEQEPEVGNIPPGQHARYTCPVGGFSPVAGTLMNVRVEYAIRPLPYFYWHGVKEARFSLMMSSTGDAYWIEGVQLGKKEE